MGEKPWWETDVKRVVEEAEVFYNRVAEVCPEKAKLPFTKKKIIEVRGWASTLKMYEKDFDRVLEQLGFIYVPTRVTPGPTFVFPIKDAEGKYSCAQTKPLEGSVLAEIGKYRYIGEKNPVGPRWLGNDRATLDKIIKTRRVMVVEGPFDILASRLLVPDAPILSPLTKLLGRAHLAYLRMLGVKDLILMYDNEEAKKGKDEGAGNMSMAQQATFIKHMKVIPLVCPKSDPSACLQNRTYAEELRRIIRREFEY